MSFEDALTQLKEGRKMYREAWLGPYQYVYLYQIPDINPQPFFFIRKMHPQEEYWPWVPTQRELLADDWIEWREAT